MPLRRMVIVLALSFLLSQQLLTQTPLQAPTSGSPPPSASSAPHNNPAKPKCTNNGTYVNSQGHTVKRPENCTAAPQGATAQCRDGTYSSSQSRRGTCSHHGGVARWL
jgi:resuscitation-promoting factor RpfB